VRPERRDCAWCFTRAADTLSPGGNEMGGGQTDVHDPFGWAGGTLEGKYRIDGVIGEGGFGVVYAAHHLGFDEPVAVKFLRLETLAPAKRDAFTKSFMAEGKILFRLSTSSPSIVRAIDVGAATSPRGSWTPYLVLELVHGDTLAEELSRRSGGRGLAEAVALLAPAARALDIAHQEGVAHRDVKPGNLILTEVRGEKTLKVLDFGVAKLMGEAREVAAATTEYGGARAFSNGYGAPEQFDPSLGATGPWTDVFALALVLVEVVTGRRALEGTEFAHQHASALDLARRPTLRHFAVRTSDAVERVLQRALSVDPRNRYRRAGEFWDELGQAVEGKLAPPSALANTEPATTEHDARPPANEVLKTEVPQYPLTVPQEPLPAALVPSFAGRTSHGATKPVASRPMGGVLFGGGAVMALGAALYFFVLRGSPEPTASAPGDAGASSTAAQLGASTNPTPSSTATSTEPAGETPGIPTRSAMATGFDEMVRAMALVPAGRYTLGSPAGSAKRCDTLTVVDGAAFRIDRTEVTVAEYMHCLQLGRCTTTLNTAKKEEASQGMNWCNEVRAGRGEAVQDHPMNCVDRSQAMTYCSFAGKRLPTDEEWERAARSTQNNEYPWGNEAPTCDKAVFHRWASRYGARACPGPDGTAPVRSTPPNALGIYDLAGNVWEWTSSSCPAAGAMDGMLRGGGFEWPAVYLPSWKRLPWGSRNGGVSTGIRCAMDEP
jgi:eukaryotic-like serine/threonine-protein kinase